MHCMSRNFSIFSKLCEKAIETRAGRNEGSAGRDHFVAAEVSERCEGQGN